MGKISIRRAVESDFDAINLQTRALFEYQRSLVPAEMAGKECEDYDRETFLDEINCSDKIWLIAECEGQAIGSCFAYLTADRYDNIFCYIDHLYVEPPFRKQGAGQRLVDEIVRFAHTEGVQAVQLDVWSANLLGREFYQNLGFSPLSYTLKKEI